MNAFSKPNLKKLLHPAFEGLSERQMVALYKDDRVRKMAAGETLFFEGAADKATYLILKGTVKLQQVEDGQIYPVYLAEEQGLISRDLFCVDGKRTATAIAQDEVNAYVLDDSALRRIDVKIQLQIYRNLETIYARGMNGLLESQSDFQIKNSQMSRELTETLLNRTSHYDNSGAIQGLLKRVPKLPPYASKLTGMLLSDDVSARDVAELARLDPSLTGAVLKTVNSSYYGLSHKVTDFQHASLLLGFTQIYQIIVSLGIQNTMPKTGQFKRLQSHSVLISIISFEISQITKTGNGPVLNTIGLLHDIGKSVLLLLISQNPKLAFFIGLLDQARIGALLLKNWEIPEEIHITLDYQNYPELVTPDSIPESCRKNVAVLYVAHLCLDYLSGKPENKLPTTFMTEYFQLLRIREKSVTDFVKSQLAGSVKKHLPTFPQEVQEFFNESLGLGHTIGNEDNRAASA